MNLLEIPGYAEAVSQERMVRDSSFLPITETIGAFEVRQMTLRDYTVLCVMRSPLLFGGMPTETELAAFLWVLSPDYSPAERRRVKFLRRCRRFCEPRAPRLHLPMLMRRWEVRAGEAAEEFFNTVKAALAYVDETFADRPPSMRRGYDKEYWTLAVSLCAKMAREYHFREEWTLAAPLKKLFQYLNEARAAEKNPMPLFQRSDKVLNDWILKNQRN